MKVNRDPRELSRTLRVELVYVQEALGQDTRMDQWLRSARTYERCHEIAEKSPYYSKVKERAIRKRNKLFKKHLKEISNVGSLVKLGYKRCIDSERSMGFLALERLKEIVALFESCDDFSGLADTCHLCHDESPEREIVKSGLNRIAARIIPRMTRFEDMTRVLSATVYLDDKIGEMAVARALVLAKSFEEYSWAAQNSSATTDQKKEALEKAVRLAVSDEDFQACYDKSEDPEIRQLALKGLETYWKKKAKTLSSLRECVETLRSLPEGKAKRILEKRFEKLVNDRCSNIQSPREIEKAIGEPWYSHYPHAPYFRILRRLLKTATTREELIEIYHYLNGNRDNERRLQEKLLKKIVLMP